MVTDRGQGSLEGIFLQWEGTLTLENGFLSGKIKSKHCPPRKKMSKSKDLARLRMQGRVPWKT